jgi:hypothetical protein
MTGVLLRLGMGKIWMRSESLLMLGRDGVVLDNRGRAGKATGGEEQSSEKPSALHCLFRLFGPA